MMPNSHPSFHYHNHSLHCEDVTLSAIAQSAGTPTYIYSQQALLNRANAYRQAAESIPNHLICYAIKANGNPHLLRLLVNAGLGADVTSGGELFLAQEAGFPAEKILFSGVGKTGDEIEMALAGRIHGLHVESEMELALIGRIAAAQQQTAPISIRINPDIAAETHPHISTGRQAHKFGVTPDQAMQMLRQAADHPWLKPTGLAVHIGSQITQIEPFVMAAQFLIDFAGQAAAQGIPLEYLDVGGGLGIDYSGQDESGAVPDPAEWVTAVAQPVAAAGYGVVMEPGRSIVGPAGLLLTKVIYTKNQGGKQFIITDAGMSDLLRPSLYNAYHPIIPVKQANSGSQDLLTADIVGPICETGDTLGKERLLPPVQPGDLLAILQAGAYGFAMSSNYNGRPKPAEVLVNGHDFHLIRRRQSYGHLLDGVVMPPGA
jgi:diaminopimelate decarboxylase